MENTILTKRMLSKTNESWLSKMIEPIQREKTAVFEYALDLGRRIYRLKSLVVKPNRGFDQPMNNRDMAHIMGMSSQNYPRLENAFHTPRRDWSITVENLIHLCVIFRVPADYLLFGKHIYKMPYEDQKEEAPRVDTKKISEVEDNNRVLHKYVKMLELKLQEKDKRIAELEEQIQDML